MADEVVYRLVLDGQAESSGSSGSSKAFSSGSRPYQAAGYPDESFNPYNGARARIAREEKAEQEDRAYRAMKRGVGIGTIEDEDHQARVDRMEAEAEAKKQAEKDAAHKELLATNPYEMAKVLIDKQQKAEELRLAMSAVRGGTTIDAVREKEQNDRIATEAEKRLQEQEKEQAAIDEKRRQAEKERQQSDPVWLAQQAMQRDQLAEQTRLQKLAMQRGGGATPEDIQNEERQRDIARRTSGYAQVGANFAAQGMRGNLVGGALGAAAEFGGPVTSVLAQSANALLAAVKQNAQENRRLNQQLTPYSGALTRTSVEEDIKDMRFRMQLAAEQGGERSRLERESRELDRREMRTGTVWQQMDNIIRGINIGLGEKIKEAAKDFGDFLEKTIPNFKKNMDRDRAQEAAEQAKQNDFMRNIPGPFSFIGANGENTFRKQRDRFQKPDFIPNPWQHDPNRFNKPVNKNPQMPGV